MGAQDCLTPAGELVINPAMAETIPAEDLLCPRSLDIDLLGDRDRIVDFDPQISDCAFDLGVAKQELNGAQVAHAAVHQRGIGPSSAFRIAWIEADAAYPTRDHSERVRSIPAPPTAKRAVRKIPAGMRPRGSGAALGYLVRFRHAKPARPAAGTAPGSRSESAGGPSLTTDQNAAGMDSEGERVFRGWALTGFSARDGIELSNLQTRQPVKADSRFPLWQIWVNSQDQTLAVCSGSPTAASVE